MKKLLITFLSLFITISVFAGQIPRKSMSRIMSAASKQYAVVVVPPAGLLYPVWENSTMTSASNPTPIIITDGGGTAAGASYQVFDRAGSFWASTAVPAWLTYDCGAGNSNACLELAFEGYPGYNVKTFSLSNSMDGANWVLILTNGAPNNNYSKVWSVTTTNYGRYFKFVYTSGWGDNYTRIFELYFSSSDYSTPVMTATNAPSPYVVTASGFRAADGSPFKAFDRNIGTGWITPDGSNYPHWIKMYVGTTGICYNGFTYIGYGQFGLNMSNYYYVASTDDVNYTLLDSGTFTSTAEQQVKTNNNTSSFNWYMLISSNGYGGQLSLTEWTPKHYK